MLVILLTDVHPFGSVTAEPISVDIVAPEKVAAKPPEPQLQRKEEETPQTPPDAPPQPDLSSKADSSEKAATASSPPPAAAPEPAAKSGPDAAPPSQKQAALAPPNSTPVSRPALTAAPARSQKVAPPLPAPVQPAYHPAQPDLSVKYHVLLGLPQDQPGDGFDAPATESADVAKDLISEFRRHLKTCSALPKEIAPSDKVTIKLRVLMTPEGRLATEPVLIEASASMKGPLLMQSAISALQACQPYAMLPPDHYQEWKILDLNFTPQDFINAS